MDLKERVKGALYGSLIADALAMPTHWFYGGKSQIVSVYDGPITGYVKPVDHLTGSIMSKSNTGGGGRGEYQGDIIGNVIFHKKKEFWKPGADYHYHQGMQAGDNTLEALLMRRILQVITRNNGKIVFQDILDDYVHFMTTPDTHNDTYCGTSHRMFFANYAAGYDLSKCPDNDGHNVDSADSITCAIPIALMAATDEEALENTEKQIYLTRNSPNSVKYARIFALLLRNIVRGMPARDAIDKLSSVLAINFKSALERRNKDPTTACYLDSSFPAALYMVYKYSQPDKPPCDNFTKGVLANSNRGGENVATGTLIGALMGAECGFQNLPKNLVEGLAPGNQEALEKEIDAFVECINFIYDSTEFDTTKLQNTSWLSKLFSFISPM